MTQETALIYTYTILGGLCIGSFLNVVIYRLPIMLERRWASWKASDEHETSDSKASSATEERFDLIHPRSRCSACQRQIKAHENIPLVSWLFLRGRCAGCKTAISVRYPLVEVATAAAFLAVACKTGATTEALWPLGLGLTFTSMLIALILIDWDTQLLPDDITLPLIWLGLAASLGSWPTSPEDAIIGAIAGYGVLWAVFHGFKLITGKEGMGYGDFKLLAALGAWLGWQALPEIILLSAVAGSVFGIVAMMIVGRDKELPFAFGPYLAIAGWISYIAGDNLRMAYLNYSGLA